MAGPLGDIVATAGIDSRQWYEEAARLGQSAKQLGGKIHEGLNQPSGSVALDAFSSTLGGGGINGAIGVAANGIEKYGASFGKFGTAVGLMASVGVTAIVSSLISQKDGFDELSSSIDTANTRLDAFIQRQNNAATFGAGLGKIADAASLSRAVDDLDTRERNARNVDKGLLGEENRLIGERNKASEAARAAALGGPASWLARQLGFDVPEDRIREQVAKLDKQLESVQGRRQANAGDIRQIDEQRRMLEEERSNIEKRDRSAQAQKIRDSDPFGSAMSQAQRIQGLVSDGFLERGIGASAVRRVVDNFRNSLPASQNSPNDAAIGGTAGGFSALQAALRAARDDSSPEAREQIALLERIARAVEQGNEPDQGEDF